MKKLLITAVTISLLTSAMAMTSFAGQWQANSQGWWYQNDGGSYPSNGWQWIDGRNYYFDSQGYCLMDTVTPDGYTVDASGAWTVNGVVQSQELPVVQSEKSLCGLYEISFGSDGGATCEITYASGDDILYASFSGSLGYDAGGTEGFLSAYTDGTDNIWDYYDNSEFELGNYNPSFRLKYDGIDSIIVTSLDGQTFGGMQFPGFTGTYARTAEYPMP